MKAFQILALAALVSDPSIQRLMRKNEAREKDQSDFDRIARAEQKRERKKLKKK